jgi:hypothetical protein
MAVDQDHEMQVLIAGVIDALGVIVGAERLHLPADSVPLVKRRRDGGPHQRSLCRAARGGVYPRHTIPDLQLCHNCLRIAAQLIRAAEGREALHRQPKHPPTSARETGTRGGRW